MKRLQAAVAASVLLVTAATAMAVPGSALGTDAGLEPREAIRKTPDALLVKPQDATGRLIVKFVDDARMRAQVNGSITAEASRFETGRLKEIMKKFRLTAVQAINQSDRNLRLLQERAELLSGRAQPDLAGMIYITGPESGLEPAALALNQLDIVEFVEFEVVKRTYGAPGACCVPPGVCGLFTEEQCADLGGTFFGEGTACLPNAASACDQGVCCLGDVCNDDANFRLECEQLGGEFLEGDDIDCADAPCLRGGCCVDEVTGCLLLTPTQCTDLGGTFFGRGSFCNPNETCATGVCCLDECRDDIDLFTVCNLFGGTFLPNQACDPDDDPCEETDACGEEFTGNCYNIDGNGSPFCTDTTCCEFICDEIDPFCCDDQGGEWDAVCAQHANSLPIGVCPGELDVLAPCLGATASCFEGSPDPGCAFTSCCNEVCTIDRFCCETAWDDGCVALAVDICPLEDDPAGPTPDLTDHQGYLTADGWPTPIPQAIDEVLPAAAAAAPANGFSGYGGEGFDLPRLHSLSEELFNDFNIDEMGMGPMSRGETINVAVIEWAWWGPEPFEDANDNGQWDPGEIFEDLDGDGGYDAGHEDLDVITEPGQTLIQIEDVTDPNHGTACLAIATALDNGLGVTGMAPNAQAWFFPLTSVEEGPRELTAWTNAILSLSPGDVISASYGPGDDNLNNQLATAVLFRLARDSYINVCVSAGNDCQNLDNATDQGDTGAMVVGATSPGAPWYRLAFSNYHTQDEPTIDQLNERSNVVHVRAWGTVVAAAGYGDLAFNGGDRHQSYTASFGGTSAAAPMIAGLAAAIQSTMKQFYGVPVPPDDLRAALMISRPGDLRGSEARLFAGMGTDPSQFCSLDVNEDVEPSLCGWYPNPAGDFSSAASRLINTVPFDGSGNIDDIVLVRGDHLFGNKFAIMARDDLYFSADSLQTARTFQPMSNPQLPQVAQVEYLASGQIADVVVVAEAPVQNFTTFEVEFDLRYPGVVTVVFSEVYDWTSNQWEFLDIDTLTGPPDDGTDLTLVHSSSFKPEGYVNPNDNRVLVRIWALGFTSPDANTPGFGQAPTTWRFNMDFFELNLRDEFGEVLP